MLETSTTALFLKELGPRLLAQYSRPKAILCMSAHWNTSKTTLSTAGEPSQIYDFSGFPAELYKVKYSCLGHAPLAKEIAKTLEQAGFMVDLDPTRGLDHGAWVPMALMFPKADIPVISMSVQSSHSSEHHFRLGEALRLFRDQGVMIVGSGGVTHNLRALQDKDATPDARAEIFSKWLTDNARSGNIKALLEVGKLGPEVRFNHPSPEHLFPFYFTLGAAQNREAEVIHQAFEYSVLSLNAFLWN